MATKARPIFLRAYDLEFDQVALNPKLTHWTNGECLFFESLPTGDQLEAEIAAFRDEIEKRMAA